MRQTNLRNELILLFKNQLYPVSVADILMTITAHKTTIYRQIEFLQNQNLITDVDLGDGIKRYESANLPHHHHLICNNCKSVEDVNLKEEKLSLSKNQFKIIGHRLEFFGLCSLCQ